MWTKRVGIWATGTFKTRGGGGTHITAHHVHREDGVSPDGSIIAAGKFYSIV